MCKVIGPRRLTASRRRRRLRLGVEHDIVQDGSNRRSARVSDPAVTPDRRSPESDFIARTLETCGRWFRRGLETFAERFKPPPSARNWRMERYCRKTRLEIELDSLVPPSWSSTDNKVPLNRLGGKTTVEFVFPHSRQRVEKSG